MKSGVKTYLYLILALGILAISGQVLAEENQSEEIFEGNLDEELGSAGITPDSPFSGIDDAFDNLFGNPSDIRKEKIAEIRIMIREGKIEEAKESLEKYKAAAEKFEKEVSPEEKENAKRSSLAIKTAIKEIEDQLSQEEFREFEEVIEQEEKIEAAAEIAGKIKELCEELSSLDPGEFYRVCKTEEDGPEWQKELFDDLSSKQEEEARKFFQVMGECFEGPENCNCEEIPHQAFSNLCSEVVPLAIECEQGNEESCEEMDKKTEDITNLLEDAPHLQRVLSRLENFEEEKFENHLPKECEEARATTRLECEEVFFRLDAPEECVDALDSKEFEFSGEREAHEICEEVLYEVYAPDECKEEGITNHEDCGRLLWDLYTPQECKDAGLTGERQNDNKKCDEIMENLYKNEDQKIPHFSAARCENIRNPEERLECYDKALGAQDTWEDQDYDHKRASMEAQCAEECAKNEESWYLDEEENCKCESYEENFYEEEQDLEIPESNYEDPIEEDEQEEELEDDQIAEEKTSNNEEITEENNEEQTSSITGSVIKNNKFLEYYYRK